MPGVRLPPLFHRLFVARSTKRILIGLLGLMSLLAAGVINQTTHSASLSSVSATLSNSRPSFRGALTTGNTEGTSRVLVNTTAGAYPSTSAAQLAAGDAVSIGSGGNMGHYTVTDVLDDGSFTINGSLGSGQADVGDDVISTQSADLTVRFTTTNAVADGAFRILVPAHANVDTASDGIPDGGSFDFGERGTPTSPPGENLRLWLDSDDEATLFQDEAGTTAVTNDNDPVGRWNDKSGFGYHATQDVSGNRPVYKTSVLSGKPVVRFNGSDTFLRSFFSYTSPTIFLVSKFSDTTDAPQDLLGTGWGTAGCCRGFAFGVGDAGNWRATRFGPSIHWDDYEAPDLGFHFLALRWSGGTNFFLDGIQQTIQSGSITNNILSTGQTELQMGRRRNNTAYFDGDIAEILIYNTALSLEKRESIERYLSEKWNLPLTHLDSDLPKVVCPSASNDYTFTTSDADIATVTISGQTYHSFTCGYLGTGAIATAFDGTSNDPMVIHGLINPAPDEEHTQGTADTYPIILQHLDSSDNVVDQTTTQIGIIEAVKVTASVEPLISFRIMGVDAGQSRCGQTTSVATSAIDVPFGSLLIDDFRYAAQSLAVSTNAVNGYSVTALANDQMGRNGQACPGDPGNADPFNADCIPDSTAPNISHTSPAVWNDPADKGFGYSLHDLNASGAIPAFEHNTSSGNCGGSECYKQFADSEDSQVPQPIFSSTGPADNHNIDICYKAVISPLQAAGSYENFITYTATATF